MNQLDTIKIVLPRGVVKTCDWKKYTPDIYVNKGTGEIIEKSHKFNREFEHSGLTYAEFNENGDFKIQASSKVLGTDPRVLINKENIADFAHRISDYCGVKYDVNQFVEQADCCIVHATKNLDLGTREKVDKAAMLLQMLGAPSKYRVQDHSNHARNGGYAGKGHEFIKVLKTKKLRERMIFYNKGADLSCKDPVAYANMVASGEWKNIEGILRAEVNLSSHHKIKQRFGISDVKLINVLNGRLNPVDEVFAELIINSKLVEPTPVTHFGGMVVPNLRDINMKGLSCKEMEFAGFAWMLIHSHKGNTEAIKQYYKNHNVKGPQITHKLKKLAPFIAEYRAQQLSSTKEESWSIRDIKELQKLFKAA
ncbi:MAG: hypothetical protein ACW98F_16650 [Candidatus Hodarchaeales archaeon]|jgi:hypothetical protein